MQLSDPRSLSLTNLIVLRKLGRGGTSHVFLAQSTCDKQLYAMKVFDKKSKSYNFAALAKEILLHKQLNHKNIVKFVSHIEDKDNHYVLTQYCEGGQLTKKAVSTLKEHQLADFLYQTASALSYMHSQGIVHCDLKLSNLLLQKGKIKICDFGYSRRLQEGPSPKICGTIFYMAPEIIREKRRVHFKEADIWALGICLLILITRQEPYAGNDIAEISAKILEGKRVQLPLVSDELQDLASRLLQMNPQNRISLEELRIHPFFLNFRSQEQKSSLRHKLGHAERLNVEEFRVKFKEQSEQIQDYFCTQPVQTQLQSEKWSFKRVPKPENKDKEQTTYKKKSTVSNNFDHEKTIKSKAGHMKRQRNKQSSIENNSDETIKNFVKKLPLINARLISPMSSFYYETKNEGFIKITPQGDITIKIKEKIFDIIDQGRFIKIGAYCYSLDEVNSNCRQRRFHQIYGLYEYALNIINLLKAKRYQSQSLYQFNGTDVIVGRQRGKNNLVILGQPNGKELLVEYDIDKKKTRFRRQCCRENNQQDQASEVKKIVQFVSKCYEK